MLGPVNMRPLDSAPFGGQSRNPSIKLRRVPSEAQPRCVPPRKVKEKDSVLGFELCRCLHWKNWELGKESTKNLTLKNVRLRTQKIKFSPPVTPFFKTLFPQTVTLSAGTSFTLPITFRPLEKRDYEDAITFETDEGNFSVALRATLLRYELLFPEELSLPTCAVYNTSEAMFVLRNVSDLQTEFRWDVPEAFLLIPARGVLDPKCEIRTRVIFQPQTALVYNTTATCHFGEQEEYKRLIQFTAIAKYPHLLVTVPGESGEKEEAGPLLDFGSVGVSMVSEKTIEIHNLSMVDSPFRIERDKRFSQVDCNFSCEDSQGVVPAHGKRRVPLQFRPRIVGMESVDYFHVIPAGNLTRTVLKVSGTCKGPCISLQMSLVNFGLLQLGEKGLRTLEVTNTSDVPGFYQFDIDSTESVFSFNLPYGTLNAKETRSIQITLSPKHPIPHYRRVACLLHHQDPLFVDLLGTCHSDMDKPSILLPKHLSIYRTNMARGLSVYSPDILDAMLDSGKLSTDSSGALTLPEQDTDNPSPEKCVLNDAVSEFFNDEFNPEAPEPISHITASTRDFNFGFCQCSCEAPLPLSLTNRTKGKVTVIWTCKPDSPFRVTPECTDIPPLKSTAFRVIFHPSQIDTLYAAELEGFVFYKVLRDYRNVKDITICPPWCITLRARGHTFTMGQEHFVPRCILDSPRMIFPPARQDGHTHRSLLLQNTGPTILTFVIDENSCPGVQVKPNSGHVDPGSHQVLLARTSPSDSGLTKHTVPLQLNYSPDYTQEIVLFSRAETPQLSLENEGKLYFKPTCMGNQSEFSYSIRNVSRIPVHFEWRIQKEHVQCLSVSPRSGIIRPNEILAQKWSFVPQEERNYFVKATVLSRMVDESPEHSQKKHYVLRINGQGCRGWLSTEQESVDLGNVLVGSFQSCDLLLSNDGDCTLEYTLSAKQEVSGPCDPDDVINDPVALEFEHEKGRLPARTKLRIRVMARPARRVSYTWTINYRILSPQAKNPADGVSEERFLCTVTAQGVYPVFSVVDACPGGSASAFSKTQIWKLFSLERLNSVLQSDPTPGELIYRVPTRHSIRRCPSVNTPVLLDFNFGAAPVGSEPFTTLLLLENKGVLPVNWDFLFPVDQQIELEFWAETWEFDQSEIHQMRIQDNKLFTINPKSGNLKPGRQQTIQLTYRHDFVGTDRLPVLLKVSHGREILLNFIGVTVEKEQRYVHFTSTKHCFTPVSIGSSSPSKQIYELFNGGSVAVIYEIQLEPLREVQEQNYHHPVFQCLNPRGEILPGATAFVEWIFSPLEAKTYSVTVPIHILGGDSALITFEGIGYDRSVLGGTAVFEAFSPLSTVPQLTLPGQIPHFTQQKLAFGDIPVFSKSSRMLFLNNTSESEAIFFTWFAASPNASEILQVSPLSGVVRPGESLSIVVSLQSGEQASFYNLELVCEIVMEKAVTEYKRGLQEWEEERERQSLEFTITEPAAEKRNQTAARSPDSRSARITHAKQQLTDIRRYKTLPPIKNTDYPRLPVSRDRETRRAMKETLEVCLRPQPPVPLQLHLSVTGRSHHTPDFLSQFQNDFPRHFQQRPYKKKMEKPAPVTLQPETGEPDRYGEKPGLAQQEMARDVMTSIIRNLLDDKQFHEALNQIQNEPLPYFTQLRGTEPGPDIPGTSVAAAEQGAIPLSGTPTEEEETSLSSLMVPEDVAQDQGKTKRLLVPQDEEKEMIKRTPLFSQLVEAILENTIQNIVTEANRGEVVLTTRPRVIALPPATPRGMTPTSSARTVSGSHDVPAAEAPEPVLPAVIQEHTV
ncbi:cilia- and flagella-associated protein 65 [Hyla sarda]|uniref:cilia- and flagella-associated protein 65 n=1 Tax=Hyla sarda TaxID=327740 RepID=UPI0024C3BAFA|nr:cilia- and flagella-associated protein 65 [Hyla sarda]XP_056390443.1 cilia- and flagella-associated protein 65 [Hyla sarda]XP_056390444.1 cilia- and flagella-associated protein 65 [Hyla sarda]